MRDGVVRRYETLKHNINTILNGLTSNINNYASVEKEMLIDLISILKYYEEAEYKRRKLSSRIDKYIEVHIRTEQYLRTPFLWFSISFLSNAKTILSVAKYHAEEFYSYLIDFMRKVFQLIRKSTSLFDLDAFELLQYECNKLQVPLTNNQLQALNGLYSDIKRLGYRALNPQRIRTRFHNYINSTSDSRDTMSVFKLLDIQFFLLFNQRAFDLEQLFIHFQLNDDTSIGEIIDFQNLANTVLCSSDLFEVRGKIKTYVGLLVSPTQFSDKLEKYLQKCVDQGKLILHDLTRITISQWYVSLALYQAEKGWSTFNPTQFRRLAHQLKIKKPRKVRLNPFFTTPPFKPIWHFQLHDQPSEVIRLYCEIPREVTFEDLPLNPINQQANFKFSPDQLFILRELYRNQVLHIGFRSHRLWDEWGLDAFWIKIPLIPLKQLVRLLQWLPFTGLFRSEHYIYFFARLTANWIKWIKDNFKWSILPLIQARFPLQLQYEWYDEEILQWKLPLVLRTQNE